VNWGDPNDTVTNSDTFNYDGSSLTDGIITLDFNSSGYVSITANHIYDVDSTDQISALVGQYQASVTISGGVSMTTQVPVTVTRPQMTLIMAYTAASGTIAGGQVLALFTGPNMADGSTESVRR